MNEAPRLPGSGVVIVAARTPPDHSGAGYSAMKYASRLMAENGLSFVLTATEKPKDQWHFGDASVMRVIRQRTIYVGSTAYRGMGMGVGSGLEHLSRGLKTGIHLRSKRRDYGIVHCFAPSWLAFFACLHAKILRKKLVMEITLLGSDCPEAWARRDWLGVLRQRKILQFRMADAIVCISPALKAACLRCGFPEKKLFVIPRAVNVEKFRPVGDDEKVALRRKLGLPENLTLILFVGGTILRKGIDLLLPAFQQTAAADPKVGLVIVGPSHKSKEAEYWGNQILMMKERAGFSRRIFYAGRQTNVNEFMQAADLFVLSSRREGFPNVLAEAMASGLASICLRIEGITDFLIEDQQDGYIVAEPTVEALASKLKTVLGQSPDVRRRIGKKARATVSKRFSDKGVDAAYRNLYVSLTDKMIYSAANARKLQKSGQTAENS